MWQDIATSTGLYAYNSIYIHMTQVVWLSCWVEMSITYTYIEAIPIKQVI